jgi:hypothetical protein
VGVQAAVALILISRGPGQFSEDLSIESTTTISTGPAGRFELQTELLLESGEEIRQVVGVGCGSRDRGQHPLCGAPGDQDIGASLESGRSEAKEGWPWRK